MFLPSHEILVVKDDGTKESIMCTDCSTKKEVRKEVEDYILNLIKHCKTYYEEWSWFQYVDHDKNVLYEFSIEEIFE